MSLFMGVFFNLQHTHPGIDKSSQVPGQVSQVYGRLMDIGITCIRTFYILDSYNVHAFVKPTYMYRMSIFC